MFSKFRPYLPCDRINQTLNIILKFLPGDFLKSTNSQNKTANGVGLSGSWLPQFAQPFPIAVQIAEKKPSMPSYYRTVHTQKKSSSCNYPLKNAA